MTHNRCTQTHRICNTQAREPAAHSTILQGHETYVRLCNRPRQTLARLIPDIWPILVELSPFHVNRHRLVSGASQTKAWQRSFALLVRYELIVTASSSRENAKQHISCHYNSLGSVVGNPLFLLSSSSLSSRSLQHA